MYSNAELPRSAAAVTYTNCTTAPAHVTPVLEAEARTPAISVNVRRIQINGIDDHLTTSKIKGYI